LREQWVLVIVQKMEGKLKLVSIQTCHVV